MQPVSILKQYWGFDHFRDVQEEIITSVLENRNTLAIMPTGGGKSICFQVPALAKPGICIVISPLIALMKDQVQRLRQLGIKALLLTGGLRQDEISEILDNAQFGNYKFLYLAPERLQTDWILDRLRELPVNLIAVDEAHCVSQWGHDFRPAYLKIGVLRDLFPKIACLALTASATPEVQKDILTHLKMPDAAVFVKSFARENLAYYVLPTEDKLRQIHNIIKKYPEPAIIYVRNRKSAIDLAHQLSSLGINTTFFHGGLPPKEKEKNMASWLTEQTPVMVATNAFGMGIDKSNVRVVIHMQIPDNPENYYQEAGRAGRDGTKAYAVLLVAPSDVETARQQFLYNLPDKAFLTALFVRLCNHFYIAYGEGYGEQFSLNIQQFCLRYNFPIVKVVNALQYLDSQGTLSFLQEFSQQISVQFLLDSKELIRYISLHPDQEEKILALVRTYPGIYDQRTPVNLARTAKKAGTTENEMMQLLEELSRTEVIRLEGKNNDAVLEFNEIREDERTINRISAPLQQRNKIKEQQLDAILRYVTDDQMCKSTFLLSYFGELTAKECGICSVCTRESKSLKNEALEHQLLELLGQQSYTSRDLQDITAANTDTLIFALRRLLEQHKIKLVGATYSKI